MGCGPLKISVVEQRIAAVVDELQYIGGAAEYAAVMELRSFRTPSAYVVLTTERGSTDLPRGTHQVTARFGVIIAARNYSDAPGTKAMNDASTIISAVRAALVGWMPASREFRACAWVQGSVLDYDQNTLLWCDEYETNYFITGAET